MAEDEVFYIDADEEITSVIDKMKGAEAGTLLLVVPKGASLLQSIVNLKLLKKEADEKGKNIAFVTTDPVGRNLAGQVGIPVYQDVEGREPAILPPRPDRPSAEEVIDVDMSDKGKKEPPIIVRHYQDVSRVVHPLASSTVRPAYFRKKLIIGMLAFLLSCAGIMFLYPKTTVVLGVKSEPYSSAIDLVIDSKATEVNKNSSILPGADIAIEQSKTTTAAATGKKILGEKAKGSVTVSNCYQSTPLLIARGTTLSSGGRNFATTAAVTVPAATIVGPSCTAGQESVNIEAASIGSDWNLISNSTFCFPDKACSGILYVSAKNSTDLQGGNSREVTFIKQEDIDAASSAASAELFAAATNELKDNAEGRSMRVLDTAIEARITEKTSDKAADTEASDAQVTTRVHVRTLAFKEADYRRLIVDLLSLRLAQGKRLILSESDEIATSVAEMNWDQGYIRVQGNVKTRVADEIDENQVKRLVVNQSVSRAMSQLLALPGIVEVAVETSPRFLNRTALFARNIIVKQEAK